MTITLSHGAVTMTPQLILGGYRWARPVQAKYHWPVGGGSPDVTGTPARPRAGRIAYAFLTQAQAVQCELEHAQSPAVSFLLADTKVSAAGMRYRPAEGGAIDVALDGSTGWWTVTVDYQELAT